MSSEKTDEPRRTIATSSLRALRAARGDTAPDTSSDSTDATDSVVDGAAVAVEANTEPGADVASDVDVDETAESATEADGDVEPVAETETDDDTDTEDDAPVAETDDDTAETDADPAEAVAAPVAEPESDTDDDDEPVADTDVTTEVSTETSAATAAVDTDDAPPVLASGGPRHTRRNAAHTTADTDIRERRRPSRLTAISAMVAAAALVFGVVGGVVWWRADHDTDRAAAEARDDVAVDARLAVATVNTSDYRKPAAALDNWLSVSAGSLKSQFTDQRKPAVTLLGQSKIITSATVLDAAVTKLDAAKGSATVIVSVNLKRKPVTGAATTVRNRFRATMTRQGDDWKLADLVLVQFQLS